MENDKKDGPGLNFNLPVIFLLLATAGNLILTTKPLVSARPPEATLRTDQVKVQHRVQARLWQDPFSALRLTKATSNLLVTNLAWRDGEHTNANAITVLPVFV